MLNVAGVGFGGRNKERERGLFASKVTFRIEEFRVALGLGVLLMWPSKCSLHIAYLVRRHILLI